MCSISEKEIKNNGTIKMESRKYEFGTDKTVKLN